MEIQLTEKQAEYIRNANKRWNFSIGAVRSGKSHLAIQYLIPAGLRARHGKKGLNLILGVTKESIERNVLEPLRELWGDQYASGINSRNMARVFGERVYCIGAENRGQVAKLRGSEIKFCYCDEIVDLNEEVFELLKSRLSLPYSVCHAAANPSYPSHFIKRFIDTPGLDLYCQQYKLWDNPFLDPEYVRSLEKEYEGTVYYLRYILGQWARAEGLIYPMFLEAIADVDGTPSEMAISIDYGTQNAFAALLWLKKGKVWHCQREYYYSGRDTGKQKTDLDYGNDLENWIADILSVWREALKENPLIPKIRVIIDPSAASFIALLQKKDWTKVMPADNDVADGIRNTAVAMQTGLIKLSPKCVNLKNELEGYVWDDTADDRPIKVNDHACDAMRYFVKTMRLVRPKTEYASLFENLPSYYSRRG